MDMRETSFEEDKNSIIQLNSFGAFAEPLSWMSSLGILLIFLTSSLANSAGIGGGPIIVCILMYLLDIEGIKSLALSQFSILGGSLIATAIKTKFRHPRKLKWPLIDYKLVALLAPPLMIGSSIGSLFSRIFQTWMVMSVLTLVALLSSYFSFKKAISLYKQETRLFKGYRQLSFEQSLIDSEPGSQWIYYIIIAVSIVFMGFFSLAKGDKYFESILDIQMCDSAYFGILVLYHVLLIAQTAFYGIYMKREIDQRPEAFEELYGTGWRIAGLAGFAYITGVFSGTLGIGGGLILNPILMGLGLNAQISTASCNLFVLTSSFTSALQFALAGYVGVLETIGITAIGLAGSLAGTYVVKKQIDKYERMSIVVYILGFMLLLVGIVIPVKLGIYLENSLANGTFSYGFRDIC